MIIYIFSCYEQRGVEHVRRARAIVYVLIEEYGPVPVVKIFLLTDEWKEQHAFSLLQYPLEKILWAVYSTLTVYLCENAKTDLPIFTRVVDGNAKEYYISIWKQNFSEYLNTIEDIKDDGQSS